MLIFNKQEDLIWAYPARKVPIDKFFSYFFCLLSATLLTDTTKDQPRCGKTMVSIIWGL